MRIREARLGDVSKIRDIINSHAEFERMLFRSLANLYECIRSFVVCEIDGEIVGCCALQVVWGDLAELKSLAVKEGFQGRGVGSALVKSVLEQARELELPRVFTLTLEQPFFAKQGFVAIDRGDLPMKVWSDCVRCPKQDHCDEVAMQIELR